MIGLGAMGAAMASNLAKAGYLHRIWNRTESKAKSLAARINIDVADSVPKLAEECDLILICVSADKDLCEIIERLVPALNNKHIIIDTSTVSAETAIHASSLVANKGAHFLDAPVSGGLEGAKNAQLVMMIGGEADTFNKVQPTLKTISKKQIHLGTTGSGQACKAVNQIMAAGINQAVSEAMAFAQAMKLDLDQVIDVVSSGAAGNWFLQNRAATMVRNNFESGFKLELHHKDLTICRKMAESITAVETRLPIVEMTLIHYQRLMKQGLGEKDISALFQLKQKLFVAKEAD